MKQPHLHHWSTNPAGARRASVLTLTIVTAIVTSIAPGNAQQRDNADRLRLEAPIGHRQPRPSDLPPRVGEDENQKSNGQTGFDKTREINICRAC